MVESAAKPGVVHLLDIVFRCCTFLRKDRVDGCLKTTEMVVHNAGTGDRVGFWCLDGRLRWHKVLDRRFVEKGTDVFGQLS